jgi:VIT1/CCC1 family predicted Fe2+/Mn2+ transporter
MLGIAYIIICILITFFILGITYWSLGYFIKNRNRRIAIGLIISLLVCAFIFHTHLIPTRI